MLVLALASYLVDVFEVHVEQSAIAVPTDAIRAFTKTRGLGATMKVAPQTYFVEPGPNIANMLF